MIAQRREGVSDSTCCLPRGAKDTRVLKRGVGFPPFSALCDLEQTPETAEVFSRKSHFLTTLDQGGGLCRRTINI